MREKAFNSRDMFYISVPYIMVLDDLSKISTVNRIRHDFEAIPEFRTRRIREQSSH